jgi:hypothetical protein
MLLAMQIIYLEYLNSNKIPCQHTLMDIRTDHYYRT